MSQSDEKIDFARQFAQLCDYEKQHSEHVTDLACQLFDLLKPLHKISSDLKWLLAPDGLLHDIGWIKGQSKHHKTSMDMILSDKTMPLEQSSRNLIALIARYHRKALPEDSHPVYGQLSGEQKRIVGLLGGILRIADGLDRSHTSTVQRLEIKTSPEGIQILCFDSPSADSEIPYGQKKADLLEQCLHQKIRIINVCK